VIGWEGWIVGRRDEQVRGGRVGVIGAGPIPKVGDQVIDPQAEERAEASGDYAVAGVLRAPLAGGQEERGQQGDEEVLGVLGEEAQDVLERVVVVREAVYGLRGLQDGAALVRPRLVLTHG
jgi:hypothetical protein